MLENYDKMMEEAKSLFNKEIVTANDQQKIQQLRACVRNIEVMEQYLDKILHIQGKAQELFALEWNICKARGDITDDVLQSIEEIAVSAVQAQDQLGSEIEEVLQKGSANCKFIKQLFTNASPIVKLLKSPALMKQHWQELAGKLNFKQIYNYFTANKEFQIT